MPILPPRGMPAAIAQGREERKALLNKVAGTLALPPTMHLHQLIKTDTPESLLPRLSEKADLMVLGHDHPAFGGHVPYRDLSAGLSSAQHAPLGIR